MYKPTEKKHWTALTSKARFICYVSRLFIHTWSYAIRFYILLYVLSDSGYLEQLIKMLEWDKKLQKENMSLFLTTKLKTLEIDWLGDWLVEKKDERAIANFVRSVFLRCRVNKFNNYYSSQDLFNLDFHYNHTGT